MTKSVYIHHRPRTTFGKSSMDPFGHMRRPCRVSEHRPAVSTDTQGRNTWAFAGDGPRGDSRRVRERLGIWVPPCRRSVPGEAGAEGTLG